MEDVYVRLARHLQGLVMGYPFQDSLLDLLKAMYSPLEAEVALAIPNDLAPLEVADTETILSRTSLPEPDVMEALESMASKNLLYSATTESGKKGYSLLQVGYGMPQTFFWHGKTDETAKKMAKLVLKYFSVPITKEVYGGATTKTYKYSPSSLTVSVPMQGVYPNEQIGSIVENSTKVAVAHCPCRMAARVLGRTDCQHSLEVCIKYDEMAEFLVDRGLARQISKDEAITILKNCEKEGLVHMVDNTQGQVKHTCNCCGHYCWNVGIIRRRRIPRDQLMAVYFIRETDLDECIGCGACADICPVDAVNMVDDKPIVDEDWCIGCGVCAVQCPAQVITIKRRIPEHPPETFTGLFEEIKKVKLGT